MKYLENEVNLNEFFKQYPKETHNEYFENLHKDYLYKFSKNNKPLLPQELAVFCKILGLKIKQPTKRQVVLFLLNKGIE